MLKFRFRKKEMRRRSNSCPNLDSCTTSFDTAINNEKAKTFVNKHNSCYLEEKLDHESDNEVLSPTRKERLHAQKSIRKVKKKEKEHQENVEKNLLSADDFWRKIDSLKEWLHDEQGSKEVESMQSPKLRSHFKKFIKLWNKRKLPLKYYKNCCVDAEAESSSVENPAASHNNQSPPAQLHGQNAFTFDFLPHATLKDLPSYHHFPFIDESTDQMASPASSSVFLSPSVSGKDVSAVGGERRDGDNNSDSPFSTFGKSMCDPHTSTSILAKQIDVRASRRKDSKSKIQTGPLSPLSITSPKKFATISRSTPASSVFKSSSPQIHAVGSPTCPYPAPFGLTLAGTEQPGLMSDRGDKNPSPAYMCVQDAIPFDSNSPSPKYWQVGFDDVFDEESPDPHYCSLSPFQKSPKLSSRHNKETGLFSNLSRNPSNLSRRRSKSMEDIYAVPSRILMTMGKNVTSPLEEEIRLTIPPVPVKRFTPTSSVVSLNAVLAGKQNSPLSLGSTESSDTLISSSETINGSERQMVPASNFSSVNSLSTDLGYHSSKFEDLSGSHRNVSSVLSSNWQPSSSFKNHQNVAGVKRRSEEYETSVDEIDSPKKNKSNLSETNVSDVDEIRNSDCNAAKYNTQVDNINNSMDMSIADFLKEPQLTSILTGSLHPTTRNPKIKQESKKKDEKDRLSILQIQVLDKSPTFPRRRIKRRSSSLAVTPGKGLTFGNKSKSNTRMAVSSPRRVSFAKNVKNCNDEISTPGRKRSSSSASKVSSNGSVVKKDISRQSHDKEEFDSFWARHGNKNRPSSPVKEGGNNSKRWSPSKWLSPSKETTFSGCESSTLPNLDDESGNGKGSFIKSLSPKKLFSSLQKNLSSSSLVPPPNNNSITMSTFTSTSNCVENTCINKSGGVATVTKPKSILKNNTITSPILVTESTHENSPSSFSPKNKETENFENERINDHPSSLGFTKSSYENSLDYCRSPPKLGVASLKAAHFASTQNLSSLPRNKQRMLFEARLNQIKPPEVKHDRQLNISLDHESRDLSPKENESHYLVPSNGTSRETVDQEFYDELNVTSQKYKSDFYKDTSRPCDSEKPIEGITQAFVSDSCGMENGFPHKGFESNYDVANISTIETSRELYNNTDTVSSLGVQLANWNNDKNCISSTNRKTSTSNYSLSEITGNLNASLSDYVNSINLSQTENRATQPQTEESRAQEYDVSHTHQHFSAGKVDAQNLDCASDAISLDGKSSCQAINEDKQVDMSEGSDQHLSKHVLERIKSFRSSPKVEENDGWITERRSSRGSKSRSFRNSPNRSLLPSPLCLQDRFENKIEIEPVEGDIIRDINPTSSLNTPVLGVNQEDSNRELLNTDKDCDSHLDSTKDDSHKPGDEVENLSNQTHSDSHTAAIDDGISVSISIDVDKGYETESRSSREDKGKEIGGVRGGSYEDESVSSMTSSDSGNCGKLDSIPTNSSSPIYDVPKTGIHTAKQRPFPQNLPIGIVSPHSTTQPISHSGCNTNPRHINPFINGFEKNHNLSQVNNSTNGMKALSSSGQSSLTYNEDHMRDKENVEVKVSVKPFKPKPLVKPKPKQSFRSGTTTHQSTTTSSLSPKVKSATNFTQPTIKRRSSLVKRESFRNTHRPSISISSSFKSNNTLNNNSNQNVRPVVRKRSSVANREDLSKKSFKGPSSAINSNRIATQKTDSKRESMAPARRSRRSSLEKGGRRSSTGVSSGPEHSSFSQRRKFFQQLQTSANPSSTSTSSTSSAFKKSNSTTVKTSNSFLRNPRPKPAPKPTLPPNREAT